MQITEIKLTNFKAFEGEHIINIDKRLTCLVGENNSGKTTIFAALDFLKNGLPKGKTETDIKNKNFKDLPVSVEITIQGCLSDVINNFSESRYLPYVYVDNGTETIRIRRSSEETTIIQNGKNVLLDIGKLPIFHPENNQFENPTGFDKAISSLLELQFVWSDMQATDVVDFGTTKTLGKLLKELCEEFKTSPEWNRFHQAHQEAFISGENAFSKRSDAIMKEIQQSLSLFYGAANVNLHFEAPDPSTFTKMGDVLINDGVETPLAEKGSGMQRAFALSVIKVYADALAKHKENAELVKPIFFFIDEPEISLHPKAQSVLVKALHEISKHHQVFLTTHSPHFLKCCGTNETCIHTCVKDNSKLAVKPSGKLATFSFSPTLAEINHKAFNLATADFHNELYGYMQHLTSHFSSPRFDGWVETDHHTAKTKQWSKLKCGILQPPEDVSLMTYVRHSIHHPENTHNAQYTESELEQSITTMLSIIATPAFQALK